ncbi:fasciclin domain-containing protein [Knoellia sp. p5-6-4]|uniref:fasciclin domain-containing protein n=1 Tax=unclassified Knoellia TaxID=2618719 RepID=UPI0023DA9F8E|nr:fasciclin domain-containing protein [Knoellia sp. p5-6-4]MDF2146285.1 fasciclin domain-containing protein [Knoellia sp. p5-6-4]
MTRHRILAVVASAALASVAGLATATSASANSGADHDKSLGTKSLAKVLAADGSGFDRNPWDYDIVDNAVHAVLKAKPKSPVKLLADGRVPLTAFLPNDRAFERLATDITGKRYDSEKDVFGAVASLGISKVETVLLYHVVPGATVDYRAALRSDGEKLKTAQGGRLTVDVRGDHRVFLVDADRDDRNAKVVQPNINKGNRQIAHGISQVLRPVDLP